MAKSSLFSGMSTTFELGSSDMHRLPAKPFAPAQSLKPLQGSWAREKNGRTAANFGPEYHPQRIEPGHGGISPWDHASPKVRATLSNMTTYDEIDRRLKYHMRGRIEWPMLKGLMESYAMVHVSSDDYDGGITYNYLQVCDERGGVRGFLCVCLSAAGRIQGGRNVAGREEHNLDSYYWVDVGINPIVTLEYSH
jgi:hypothetical protein